MRNPFIRTRAHQDALAWLARMKRGLRPDEGAQLIGWLRRRGHRRVIAKAAAEWHGPEVLAVLSEIFPIDPAILEPRRGHHPALVFAVIAAGAVVILNVPNAIDLMMGVRPHVYATARRATQRLAFEDGTHVELNRGTQINVLYAAHVRTVLLARGEALFEVASEQNRPFRVDAAGRNVETDSATFDIRLAAPDKLNLTVLAGTVTIFPRWVRRRPDGRYERVVDPRMPRPITLRPLQMLTIEPDQESDRTLTQKDMRSRLSWQGGT